MKNNRVSFWARNRIKVPDKVIFWDRKNKKKIILEKRLTKEQKKLRKLIKKNYSHKFRDFLNSLINVSLAVSLILFTFALAFYVITRPMILAMLLTFAITFYIIKKLSETPMSKLEK